MAIPQAMRANLEEPNSKQGTMPRKKRAVKTSITWIPPKEKHDEDDRWNDTESTWLCKWTKKIESGVDERNKQKGLKEATSEAEINQKSLKVTRIFAPKVEDTLTVTLFNLYIYPVFVIKRGVWQC